MNYLFVGGCPRSGTTALLDLLNAHPEIALGKERFKKVNPLRPEHFEIEHFLRPTKQQTNILAPEHYLALRRKIVQAEPAYLGDKTPGYYRRLADLSKTFPAARFLIIWRDPVRVASSFEFRVQRAGGGWSPEHDYRNALTQWHTALQRAQDYLGSGNAGRLMLVNYDWFFSGDLAYVGAVFNFLGLPVSVGVTEAYATSVRKWNRVRKKELSLSSEQAMYVEANKDQQIEAWAREVSATHMACWLDTSAMEIGGPLASRLSRQFQGFTAANRLEQLQALGGLFADGSQVFEREIIGDLEGLVGRIGEIERKAGSILEQIRTAEDSTWAKLGANLDLRKPRRLRDGEKTISQQTAEMNEALERFRANVQALSDKLRQ